MFLDNVAKVDIKPIYFNGERVDIVYIDHEHVNQGKSKTRTRSYFTIEDILKFIFLLDGINLEPEIMSGNYLYFSRIIRDVHDKPFKIVFCQDYSFCWIGSNHLV